MSMPSTSSTSLEGKWRRIKAITGNVKNMCGRVENATAITRSEALEIANVVASARVDLEGMVEDAATSGLLEYARAQENNPTLDLVAAFQTMKTQLTATRDWFVTNFPNDGAGGLAVLGFDAVGRTTDINLTAGQLAAVKAQFAAIDPTID